MSGELDFDLRSEHERWWKWTVPPKAAIAERMTPVTQREGQGIAKSSYHHLSRLSIPTCENVDLFKRSRKEPDMA